MMKAADAVVWVQEEHPRKVLVRHIRHGDDGMHEGFWCDPIGAREVSWRNLSDDERVRLMLETALDLAMDGLDLGEVLREFAKVEEFRALGNKGHTMSRALSRAIVGVSLDMCDERSFDDLMRQYAPDRQAAA
jgi:hypothetical protein